ncbi:MAG: putative RNA uridine N3 methyltransferase [Acidilobus sp.]
MPCPPPLPARSLWTIFASDSLRPCQRRAKYLGLTGSPGEMYGGQAEDHAVHDQGAEAAGEGQEVLTTNWAPWPSTRRRWPLEVLVPGSVLSTEQDLRDKTYKAGLISRTLAIFRVDAVTVFRDDETSDEDLELLTELLRYQATPAHLRKLAFPLKDELRFAGLMPPLNLPNHEPPRKPYVGLVIDGLVTRREKDECEVFLGEIGVGRLPNCSEERGTIVTVSVASIEGDRLRLSRSSWGETYVGYAVRAGGQLADEVKRLKSQGFAIIGTSRYGTTEYWRLKSFTGRPIAIIVGGPETGLLEYLNLKSLDLLLNSVPAQGTRTVRSEEALMSTLAIVNAMILS